MWKERQRLLPRHERRPLPKAPMSITDMQAMKVDSGDVESMDRFNRQQMAAYTQQGLVQCQHCQRSFLQEKSQQLSHVTLNTRTANTHPCIKRSPNTQHNDSEAHVLC
jgi:hypothetical protein